MKIYKLFVNPIDTKDDPLTYERLIQWLIDTKWIEGHFQKRLSPLDKIYEEDYLQEIWYQILCIDHSKLLDIWHRGKGKFVNYIKSLITNNLYSTSSHVYKNIRKCREGEILLDDEQWHHLINKGDVDYEFKTPKVKWKDVTYEYETQTLKTTSKLYEP